MVTRLKGLTIWRLLRKYARLGVSTGMVCASCITFLTSTAGAEVGTAGSLKHISSALMSSPHEVQPLISAENSDYECTDEYSDIQSGANSWVIGNCPKGNPWKPCFVSLRKTPNQKDFTGLEVGLGRLPRLWLDRE